MSGGQPEIRLGQSHGNANYTLRTWWEFSWCMHAAGPRCKKGRLSGHFHPPYCHLPSNMMDISTNNLMPHMGTQALAGMATTGHAQCYRDSELSAVACQRSEFPGNAASSDGVFGRRECHDVNGILLMAGLDLSRRCRWSYEGLVVVPGPRLRFRL
ncbi:uncharacterized protein MEPE_05449 [Melanopsichium pennsylvanicum]|uniref:Uncharacterized protein n=1 Tax=Melanopsichium pennsylvanicum TaxID=63383 RepID=A0AAJ4XQP2_9BASI|nr:uncharacterized protein MEPE_05449 [Melanopsichium pennsylvanicum]